MPKIVRGSVPDNLVESASVPPSGEASPLPPVVSSHPAGVSVDKRGVVWFAIARWCLLGLLIILPIFFIPGLSGLVSLNQQTLIVLLVLCAFIAWVVGTLATGQLSFPRLHPAIIVLPLAFVAGAVLSLVFSPAARLDFWGINGGDTDALVTVVMALLALLLASHLFRSLRDLKAALIAIEAAVLLSVLFAAGNVITNSLFHRPFFGITNTAFNLIGSVNIFSLFLGLGFLLPFSSLLSLKMARRASLLWYIVPVAVAFIALVLIGHQLTFIILSAALFAFLVFWLVDHAKRVHDHLLQFNAILFAFFVFIMLAFSGYRFVNLPQMPIEIMPSTAASWSIAKQALREGVKPLLLGTGPATYPFTFDRLKPLAINLTPFWNIEFRQGASWWLTVLPSFGLIATAALILFLLALLGRILRQLNASGGTAGMLIRILLLSAGYLLIASFCYPTSLVLLLFLFMVVGLLTAATATVPERVWSLAIFRTPQRALLASLLLTGALAGSIFLVSIAGRRYAAALFVTRSAAVLAQSQDRAPASALAARSYNLFPTDETARYLSQLWLAELNQRLGGITKENAAAMQPQVQAVFNSAVQFARLAVDLYSVNHQNWALLGDIYQSVIGVVDGADKFALDAYQQAASRYPTSPVYPIVMAQVRVAQADRKIVPAAEAFAVAERDLQEAVRIKPDSAGAHLLIAQLYERQGKLKEAIAKTQEVLRQQPNNVGVLFALGALQYRANDLSVAKETFSRALGLNENYSNARYFLGLIAEKEGDKGEAIRQFEAILELNPDNTEVREKLESLRSPTAP